MFIGRKKELATLNEAFASDRQENVLTYGRRRVGKTELIKEAIKGKKAIYYEAKEISAEKTIDDLSLLISEILKLPRFRFDDIESLLDLVFKKAIDETNRRRSIQEAYNRSHGIIPKTIIKEIREPIHGKETKEMARKFMKKKVHTKKDRDALISSLTKEMKAAAKAMEFEKAAELRDMILELKADS